MDDGYKNNFAHSFDEGRQLPDTDDIKAPPSLLPRLMQRLQASHQMEQMGDDTASLQIALNDTDEFVRATAIRALAHWQGNIADIPVERLLAALSDSSWLVREAAIITLDTLQIEVSQEHQMMALLDENEFVREAARLTFTTSTPAQPQKTQGVRATEKYALPVRLYRALSTVDSLFFSIHLPERRGSIMTSLHHDSKNNVATNEPVPHTRNHPRARLGIAGTLIAVLVIVSIGLSWFAVVQKLPHNAARHSITPPDRSIFTDIDQFNNPQVRWLDGNHITLSDPLGTPYVNMWDVHIQYLHQENLFGLLSQDTSQYGDIQYYWTPDNKYVVNGIAAPDTTPTASSIPTNYTVTIEVQSVATGQKLVTVSYHETIVPSPANNNGKSITPPVTFISPDDTRLEVGQSDGNITIWSLKTGKQVASYHLDSSPVGYVQWSANSQRLLAQSSSGLVVLWDTTTGQEISSFLPPSYEQADASSSQKYHDMPATPLLSPDGTLMAGVVGANNRVDVWDAVTTKVVGTFKQPANQIAYINWLSNSKQLSLFTGNTSSTSSDAKIEIWSLVTNQIGLRIAAPSQNSSPSFSPSSKYVAVESASSKDIAIWNTSTNQQVSTLHNGVTISQDTPSDFVNTTPQIVAWSPDERYVATISKDPFNPSLNTVIRVWDVTTGKIVMQYHSQADQVLQVAWSPDGKYLGSVSDGNLGDVLEVWQAPR